MPTVAPLAIIVASTILVVGADPFLPPAAVIRPANTAPGDNLGFAVDLDGATAIVGAWLHDGIATDSGAAFLYNVGDPEAPSLIAELAPLIPSMEDYAGNYFGYTVAIDGGLALVGSWGANDLGYATGSVCVFDAATGQRIARFTAADAEPDTGFGWSVALHGDIALVGAIADSDAAEDAGAVYVFDLGDPAAPVQIAKIIPADAVASQRFGGAVSLWYHTAIIGAPGDTPNGRSVGAAYLFDLTVPAAPTLIDRLDDADGAEFDEFGWDVAVEGGLALVGAAGHDLPTQGAGAAYLYNATTGQLLAKLSADDAARGDSFGTAVALDGGRALIGATGAGDGRVYVYDLVDPLQPAQLQTLRPPIASAADELGVAAALAGGLALVGDFADDTAGDDAGAALLFNLAAERICETDIDGDGATDVFDFASLAAAFGSEPGDARWNPAADLIPDGAIDVFDYNALLTGFGCRLPTE
jgi:hypothetical protein